MASFFGPIVGKSATERKVFGPVMIPNEPDLDGDVVSADKIEQVHDLFNEKYANIDVQHSLQNVGKIYTSYIAPTNLPFEVNGQKVIFPKGTWMMGVKVHDDQAWQLVQDGKLTGFSIMAVNPALKGTAAKSEGGRTTLNDLGNQWIVNAVSLVDEPAVPRAKFIAIKSATGTLWDKVMKSLTGIVEMISSEKASSGFPTVDEYEDDGSHPYADDEKPLDDLNDLTPGETEPENNTQGGEDEVNAEDVQKLIADALAPILDQLKQVQDALSQDAQEDAQEDAPESTDVSGKAKEDKVDPKAEAADKADAPAEDNKQDTEDAKADEEDSKEDAADEDLDKQDVKLDSELVPLLQQVLSKFADMEKAQKSAPTSKRLLGQDGFGYQNDASKSVELPDRDALGRRIKKR